MSAISRTAGQDENIVRWTVAPLQLAFDMKKRVFLQHLSNAVRTLGMELLNTIDATPEHLKFSLFASTSKHKPHYVSTSAKRRTPLTNCRKLSDVLRSISMCGATRFAPAIC